MSKNSEKLWQKIFNIADHTEGAYKLVHGADGNVSNEKGAYEDIKFLFEAYEALEAKIEGEEYRQAHNLEHLDLDARIVLKYDHDEDVPMLSPQIVALVLLFRYIEYHPKREAKENFKLSQKYAVTTLTDLLAQINTFRTTKQDIIAKFPELEMKWFNEEFIAQLEVFFNILIENKIPTTFTADFYTNNDYNTAAWILDIHNSINGQDSTNHTAWEVGLRSEQAGMSLDDYKRKRQAEWTEIKKYTFTIASLKKEYGGYVKSNIEDFDFDMNEPYEEDLEELVSKLPAL